MTELVHVAYLAFLAGILGTTVVAYATDNLPAVVNGIFALVVVLLPTGVEIVITHWTGGAIAFGIELQLWLAIAGFLHMLGMLGWYDTVWWWDHLTHTVSAALIAAVIYAGTLSVHRHVPSVHFTPVYVAGVTILFTLAIGVFWEFLELASREAGKRVGKPPVLEYYGLRDTVFDMVFNAVGAILVVTLDVRVFVPITDQHPSLVATLLVVGGGALLVGTLALVVLLEISHQSVRRR